MQRRGRHLKVLIPIALALPLAYALDIPVIDYKSIAQLMGLLWNTLGSFFSFQYVSQTPALREGILKFLVFILVLRVVQVVTAKRFDNKTAGIIGFVVAAITVIFTPNTFLISSVVALLVPLSVVLGIMYLALFKFNESRWQHFLGAILLFVDLLIIGFIQQMFKDWNQFEPKYMAPFVMNVLSLLVLVVLLAFIVKLFQALFSGVDGSSGLLPWNWKKKEGAGKEPGDDQEERSTKKGKTPAVKTPRVPRAPPPRNFKVFDNPRGAVDLNWDSPWSDTVPPEHGSVSYKIQRRLVSTPPAKKFLS